MNKETIEILKYANKMFIKIRETSRMLNGITDADNGVFGYIEECIFNIIFICLSPVIVNNRTEDEFIDLASIIMYADENKLDCIIQAVKNQMWKDLVESFL